MSTSSQHIKTDSERMNTIHMTEFHSRAPSECTNVSEKTTKSNKSWKLPRMKSDGRLRAKLTRMTSGRRKAQTKDAPAVPSLPQSVHLPEKSNIIHNQEHLIPSQAENGSSLLSGMSECLEGEMVNDSVLKPPTPAFLGIYKRRNSSRSSLTTNSESGSEFGSERSFSAYSTSSAHSPLYLNHSTSSHSGTKAFMNTEKDAKPSIANTIKTFGRRMKGCNEVQKSSLNPLITSIPSASASAPQLSWNEYTIEQDPFRSAPFYIPNILPSAEKDSITVKSEEQILTEIQSSTSSIARLQNNVKGSPLTAPPQQENTHNEAILFTNSYFFKSKKIINQSSSAINEALLLRSSDSNDEYGEAEKVGSRLSSHRVTNISPKQSPMVSPTTLLPPTPPFSPLRSNGGLTTSGRKALYACTIRKLHPQIRSRLESVSPVTLKSPRSINLFNDLQAHPSTTSHLRNLPVLLARTRITRRLRSSTLTTEEEEEIQTFVDKGYLNIYLSPREVGIRITQKNNNNVQAEALTKPPLLSCSSSTAVNENGMINWIQRKAFIDRMKVTFLLQNGEDFKTLTSDIEENSFRGLNFSQRCTILAFGDNGTQSQRKYNHAKENKSFARSMSKNDNAKSNPLADSNKESQSLPDEDDVPLALLRKQRSKSSTSQIHSSEEANDQLKLLQKNKKLISEARHRRQQSDRPHLPNFASQPQIPKVKTDSTRMQSLHEMNANDEIIASSTCNLSCQRMMTSPKDERHSLTQSRNKHGTISRRTSMSMPATQTVAMVHPQPILMTQWSNPVHVPLIYGNMMQPMPMHQILYPMPISTVQMGLSLSNANPYPDVHRETQRFNSRNTPKRSPLSQNVYNA
ncbi:hypothetical protein L7F22_019017 [Adiantum nelumboides]|nr:hypothetical protein [Adiantum nelumboides]